MSLSAIERFFSLLALLAAALAVLIVVLRLVPTGRPWLGHLAPAKRWLAFLIAATAMVGSLYFSESQHFEPCKLCWYQRIAMYPLVAVLGVGIVLRDDKVGYYGLPLSIAGLAVSIYHNLLYYGLIPESITPCTEGISCTSRQIEWLGFITIPLMALTAFTIVTLCLTLNKVLRVKE